MDTNFEYMFLRPVSQTTKNLTFTTFDSYYCGLLSDIELKLSDGALVSPWLGKYNWINLVSSDFWWRIKFQIEVNGNLTQ